METLIDRALSFATIAHHGQTRKNGGVFIEHPIQVANILAEIGVSPELVAAGFLHDVAEDTDIPLEVIYKEFGTVVGDLVKSNTEDKDKTWMERKMATIQKIPYSTMNERLLLVADKISNVTSIKKELEQHGEKTWDMFNKGYYEQRWYYTTIATALFMNLEQGAPVPQIFNDYYKLVQYTFFFL